MVYFAEKDNPSGPWSFLDSFWWGLMTLTTVGYGDLSPSTFPGKLIGMPMAYIMNHCTLQGLAGDGDFSWILFFQNGGILVDIFRW